MSKELEVRHVQLDEVITKRADDEVVSFGGYVVKFDTPSLDMGFIEYVDKRAFNNTLKNNRNIFALYNHDWNKILGSTNNESLKLSVDDTGLRFELIPKANTSYLRDVQALVDSGELKGASFGFKVNKDDRFRKDGKNQRILKNVSLHEITLTAMPAYQSSEVVSRSYQKFMENQEEQRNKELELLKIKLDLLKLNNL